MEVEMKPMVLGKRFTEKPDGNWKRIPNCNNRYWVCSSGRVLSEPNPVNRFHWVIQRGSKDHGGYPIFLLIIGGKAASCKMHRMVATAFLDNPEKKRCVNHKDGNKSNNDVSNLEWATHKENSIHAFQTGLNYGRGGEGHSNSKITNQQSIDIANSTLKTSEICAKFSVSKDIVLRIKSGKSWSKYTNKKRTVSKTLKERQIIHIFYSELPIGELAELYNLQEGSISNIKSGRTHSKVTGKKYVSSFPKPLKKEIVLAIYYSTLSHSKIAKKFNTTIDAVSCIKRGKIYFKITGHKYNPVPVEKLPIEKILEIYNSKLTANELAIQYNKAAITIYSIWDGRNYSNITKHKKNKHDNDS